MFFLLANKVVKKINTMQVDQHVARQLLVDGATFIFLDVPPGTEFGIDMKSWNTGEKFKGVKMIPPGLHYVHYSAINKHGDLAPRVGFLHNFTKSEFVFKKWDNETEDISTTELGEEEKDFLKVNLLNLDKCLGPYPFDIWQKWKSLTSKITESLVLKLTPESGRIRSALELVSSPRKSDVKNTPLTRRRRSRPTTDEEREEDLLPQLKPSPGTELRFTPFPEENYPEGSTPAEITRHSLDSSFVLETMIASLDTPSSLIGELQFSFICFLVGHSLEAFEHWKRLVGLICSCEAAVPKRRDVYTDFITTLEIQLGEIETDFLVDIVASQNFVYQSLRTLFLMLQTNELVDGRLKTKAARFREQLTLNFEWDFTNLDEEDDDEAPVIVDLH